MQSGQRMSWQILVGKKGDSILIINTMPNLLVIKNLYNIDYKLFYMTTKQVIFALQFTFLYTIHIIL